MTTRVQFWEWLRAGTPALVFDNWPNYFACTSKRTCENSSGTLDSPRLSRQFVFREKHGSTKGAIRSAVKEIDSIEIFTGRFSDRAHSSTWLKSVFMLTQLFLKLTYVGAEWVMWMLLLLSIISIALMVERWLYFYRTRIDGDDLAARLDEQLRARNLQGAWQLVKDTHTT